MHQQMACALIKLGTSSGFIGCVGKDQPGDELVQLLQLVGVDAWGTATSHGSDAASVRSESGDRIFAGFREHDTTEFADTRLQASQLPVQLFEAADFLVLGTLELAYPASAIAYFTPSSGRAVRCQDFTGCELATCWPNPDTARQTIQQLFKQIDFLKLRRRSRMAI